MQKGYENRYQVEMISIEDLVPQDHLLRQISEAVDLSKIYEFVEELYCDDNGRPSVDPVVLFKMVLIQHLYGLPSLRRTADEVSLNNAYRCFLGYGLTDETPHFSTISYNFRHRFKADTIDKIFAWILSEAAEAGYLKPEAVFIDGTHIKANANTKKKITQSTTDPESGLFVKGEHQRQFAYEAHTACDKNGFVLETVVTPGNVHDSVAFDDVYDKLVENFPEIETIVADSAYNTPHICKRYLMMAEFYPQHTKDR